MCNMHEIQTACLVTTLMEPWGKVGKGKEKLGRVRKSYPKVKCEMRAPESMQFKEKKG